MDKEIDLGHVVLLGEPEPAEPPVLDLSGFVIRRPVAGQYPMSYFQYPINIPSTTQSLSYNQNIYNNSQYYMTLDWNPGIERTFADDTA